MKNYIKTYPKILVVAHNPFSLQQNNGKTLSAFFKDWPKDKIAQIYLTLDKIDTEVCENYYRISDVDVLKTLINNEKKCGVRINIDGVDEANCDKEKESKRKIYIISRNLARKKNSIIWWLRTLMWERVKPWLKKDFNNWIEEFSPDIIFFQTSNFYTIFNMVQYIKDKTNAKLFIETTDDYVTPGFTFNFLKYLKEKKMEKYYKILINKSECVFAIGEKMAKEYKDRFGGIYEIAMNSIEINEKTNEYLNNNIGCILTYAGNLGLNRWKILYKLGMQLDKLNTTSSFQSKLYICSLNLPSKKIMKKFLKVKSIEYKGALNSQQLIELKNKSDVLVHVESFDKKNRKITRLSISTKIPEYMLSKRCILAIGPEDVASIEYIKNNNAGMVITSKNDKTWGEDLEKILYNYNIRCNYLKYAYSVALKNHLYKSNKEKIQNKLRRGN